MDVQRLIKNSVSYMTPFISSVDIVYDVYNTYGTPLSEEAFGRQLNRLMFNEPLSFVVPGDNQSEVYWIDTTELTIQEYIEDKDDPATVLDNPMIFSTTGITGNFTIRSVSKCTDIEKQGMTSILSALYDTCIKMNRKLKIKPYIKLTWAEKCRLSNMLSIIDKHVNVLKMCARFVAPIKYTFGKNKVYIDKNTITSFQFYVALLTGLITTTDNAIFNESIWVPDNVYIPLVQAFLYAPVSKPNRKESAEIQSYELDNEEDIVVLDLTQLKIGIVSAGYYLDEGFNHPW